VSPKTMTLAELEAEQQRRAEEAERIQQQAREARQREHARQEKRRDDEARRLLDTYDEAALDQRVTRAEARLREAVLADPVHAAAIDLLATRITRYEEGVTIGAAATRLNETAPAPAPVGSLDLPEYVAALVQTEAADRAEDQRTRKGRP
jgi:hypothetical protein